MQIGIINLTINDSNKYNIILFFNFMILKMFFSLIKILF